MRHLSGLLLLVVAIVMPAHATQDWFDRIPVRNTEIRVHISESAVPALGSIIVLAGGSGRLDIDDNGRIRDLTRNQLIRTRGRYALAGYVVAAPDVTEDFKRPNGGVRDGYRWSAEHAADIGILVETLRKQTPKVYLVGTSRGALSVANAAARLQGAQRPDAIVITSGMLMQTDARQPSVQRMVKPLEAITMPVLLVAHENDACPYTPASATRAFRSLLSAAAKTDLVTLTGGTPDRKGEECEADGHHGFAGLDDAVVGIIIEWLKALP